jgi:hypothetical protein
MTAADLNDLDGAGIESLLRISAPDELRRDEIELQERTECPMTLSSALL